MPRVYIIASTREEKAALEPFTFQDEWLIQTSPCVMWTCCVPDMRPGFYTDNPTMLIRRPVGLAPVECLPKIEPITTELARVAPELAEDINGELL